MKTIKKTRPRPTFEQVRQQEREHYEPLMQELANEINALRDELEAARETLSAVRGSWITGLRYYFKGHV
jgi:hypothetical protein